MSKPTTNTIPPMRVDREFAELMHQIKGDLARQFNVEPRRISNPIVTKRICKLAKIGKYYENKKIDPVEKVMNRLLQ